MEQVRLFLGLLGHITANVSSHLSFKYLYVNGNTRTPYVAYIS